MSDYTFPAFVLALCLGIGGCSMMNNYGHARLLEVQRATAPGVCK